MVDMVNQDFVDDSIQAIRKGMEGVDGTADGQFGAFWAETLPGDTPQAYMRGIVAGLLTGVTILETYALAPVSTDRGPLWSPSIAGTVDRLLNHVTRMAAALLRRADAAPPLGYDCGEDDGWRGTLEGIVAQKQRRREGQSLESAFFGGCLDLYVRGLSEKVIPTQYAYLMARTLNQTLNPRDRASLAFGLRAFGKACGVMAEMEPNPTNDLLGVVRAAAESVAALLYLNQGRPLPELPTKEMEHWPTIEGILSRMRGDSLFLRIDQAMTEAAILATLTANPLPPGVQVQVLRIMPDGTLQEQAFDPNGGPLQFKKRDNDEGVH